MSLAKGISVILPNYNGEELLKQYFFRNLEVFNTLIIPFEVIIIDDASTDNSVNYIKANLPENIILIQKTSNSGFSKTCNLGIREAKYSLIFLLNTDVLLTENYFDNILKYVEERDTFGIMGRIIGMDNDIIQDAARFPKLYGKKIKPSNFYYADNEKFVTPTLYLSGAISLIDTEKLKTLGGFNELFSPFYGEDFELSLRAWRMGWICYYDHRAICRHEVSSSTKSYQKKDWIKTIYFRNRYFAHYLHLNGLDLVLWHLQILVSDIIPSIFLFKTYKLKAYVKLLKSIKSLNHSKKEFKQLLQVNNSHLTLSDVFRKINNMIKGIKVTSIEK